jgi:NAD+ diphosphatase
VLPVPWRPRANLGRVAHPHEILSLHPHDRLHEHRKDEAWLDARWADPATRVLVVSGTRIRPRDGRADWVSPAEAPEGLRVLLGEVEGQAWFAVVTGPEVAKEARDEWLPLRGLLGVLADGPADHVAPLVLHAMGIAEWLFVTRFCPRCAEPLTPRAAGHELVCANGHTQFPRTDAAVIMLVTYGEPGSDDELCLLGRQAVWPEGRFSTLAGFYEPGESLEDAVRREVGEEVGVRVGEVEYFGNQPWPLPASLMIGMVGRATSTEITVDQDEIEEARWFTRAEMREQAESGTVVLPGGISISRSLVEHWYGGELPGAW